MVNGSSAGALAEEEEPLRWILKHGEQYTGRSWVGRKGTVVDAPHAKQTAWYWGLEVNDLGRHRKGLNRHMETDSLHTGIQR